MVKRLIINADDFGPNRRICDAVVLAARGGALTSTSVLVNLAADISSPLAMLRASGVGVGVHLNVTSGRALAAREDLTTLVDGQGVFLGRQHLCDGGAGIDPDQLCVEFTAQIDRLSALGLAPTHLDNHHPEIYLHPKLFQVVIDLAAARQLPIRMPLSCDENSPLTRALAARYGMTPAALAAIGADLRARCQSKGVSHPDAFFLGLDEQGSAADAFARFLADLSEGTSELCVHLGVDTPAQRRELAAITGENIAALIASQGIELVSFAALAP